MSYYPGLLVKAKHKISGRVYTVREKLNLKINNKVGKYFAVEHESCPDVKYYQEHEVELVYDYGRDRD